MSLPVEFSGLANLPDGHVLTTADIFGAGLAHLTYSPYGYAWRMSNEIGDVVHLPADAVPTFQIAGLVMARQSDVREADKGFSASDIYAQHQERVRAAQMELAVAELRDGDSA